MTSTANYREFERKIRVSLEFRLETDAIPVVSVSRTHAPVTMSAVYHDTADLALLRWGVTLRRREGGKDEGWHLKLPVQGADGSTRDEVRLPLTSGDSGFVPAEFINIIAPFIGERNVVPLVIVTTERLAYELSDDQGRPRVELVDDRVAITRDGHVVDSFREIEVEAIDANEDDSRRAVDSVAQHLVACGGEASSVSKAAQALGSAARNPADVPDLPMPGADSLAVDAIRAILSRHVRHLILADVAVRRDLPDAVHQCRVAARRLRSTLATFRPLLDGERVEILAEELSWLARELGAMRDNEVLLERLLAATTELDPDAGAGAAQAIDEHLRRRMLAARSSVTAALRSDRHQELIDDLTDIVANPPVNDLAFVPAREALTPVMAQTWRTLAKSVRHLHFTSPSSDWHKARIKAKRARYTADSLAGVFGKPAGRLAKALATVTEVLGSHQDAHVAQKELESIARDCEGVAAFALGRLYEYEVNAELLTRIEFSRTWRRARKNARRSGLV